MREPVTATTGHLEGPSEAQRGAALGAERDQATHDRFMAEWPCMQQLETADPPASPAPPAVLTVAAWNLERCKRVAETASILEASGVDILLASEMDMGMARSGQRHTTADLARALGFGHVFGVEFVELGPGDAFESEDHRGERNEQGLHGNAILSRWPLLDPALIPLGPAGRWYTGAPKDDDQVRIGGRMAITARVRTVSGPVTLACLHFESQGNAEERAAEAAILLERLDARYGKGPAIVGGDLNTKGLEEAGLCGQAMLDRPFESEPAFIHFQEHGFDWHASNTGAPTTRANPRDPDPGPPRTLDWLFVRKLDARSPFVLPALSKDGLYLSDHELIGCEIRV